jgi:aryl-alcohol dehydrogenase-like predicted oxidoreductase
LSSSNCHLPPNSAGWGANKEVSKEIFKSYIDSGGNFVDTADIYSGGLSEELTGEFIHEMKLRNQVVLATKFAFNGAASPLSTEKKMGNPNAGGAGGHDLKGRKE